MDYLRSCYSTTMHLKDGDPRVSDIQWYWAPDDAQRLPFRTVFGSHNWTLGTPGDTTVGEIAGAPRPWSNGAAPVGVQGTNYCGDESDYLGIADFQPVDNPLWPNGLPTCCAAAPAACQPFNQNVMPDFTVAPHGTQFAIAPFPPSVSFYWLPSWLVNCWVFAEVNGIPCGPEWTGTHLYLLDNTGPGPVEFDCTLTGYDPLTGIGSWKAPDDATFFAGQTILVHFGPEAPCVPWVDFEPATFQFTGYGPSPPTGGHFSSGYLYWDDSAGSGYQFYWGGPGFGHCGTFPDSVLSLAPPPPGVPDGIMLPVSYDWSTGVGLFQVPLASGWNPGGLLQLNLTPPP